MISVCGTVIPDCTSCELGESGVTCTECSTGMPSVTKTACVSELSTSNVSLYLKYHTMVLLLHGSISLWKLRGIKSPTRIKITVHSVKLDLLVRHIGSDTCIYFIDVPMQHFHPLISKLTTIPLYKVIAIKLLRLVPYSIKT